MTESREREKSGGGTGSVGWIDLAVCLGLLLAGAVYLWDARRWAAGVYVGRDQYGDAQFWWDGALHFSQGIVADNPNLLYRMGYAAFGGAIAAVFGPNYLIFHKVLLGLFLAAACGLYCQLQGWIGRIAAAAGVALLVFNPYTAEWLAISSSDGLGMILNLAAMLALGEGLRRPLRFVWLALFGMLLAAGSLTRPLMTFVILPAGAAVWAASGWRLRPAAKGWAAIAAPFLALTLVWMVLMAVLSGNFAISGRSQDSSIFYAASDPTIQVWRPDMIPPVEAAARRRFHTSQETPSQRSQEFWSLTRANYRRYWRYHLGRWWRHIGATARLTPLRATDATPLSDRFRFEIKLGLALLLAVAAAARRQWLGAAAAAALGAAWALWPQFHAVALLLASAAGLLGLFWPMPGGRRRPQPNRMGPTAFIWASYWWAGVLALYLTGGSWGPPLASDTDINALGYRLGFQFFFAADLLIVGALAYISRGSLSFVRHPEAQPTAAQPALSVEAPGRGGNLSFFRPSAGAATAMRTTAAAAAAPLLFVLVAGAGVVGWRLIARGRTKPLPYPDLGALNGVWMPGHNESEPAPKFFFAKDIESARAAIAAATGARLVTSAMSSGFVWNLEGQDRCMLLIYQQQKVQPVRMMPNWLLVEIPRHLPESRWRLRQGAWLLRSFPDAPVASNRPYYSEVSAVQEFIPLAADGRSYAEDHAEVFPIAKYASQLAASGQMTVRGTQPLWVSDSGAEKYPRRFALRAAASADAISIHLDLSRVRGRKTLHFGWRIESTATGGPWAVPVELDVVGIRASTRVGPQEPVGQAVGLAPGQRPGLQSAHAPAGLNLEANAGNKQPLSVLWAATSRAGESAVTRVEMALTPFASARFECDKLPPGATLWLYEFVLSAEDFPD